MLGDIDLSLEPEKMRLYLAKADMNVFSELSEAYDKKRTKKLTELNTLQFSLPYYDEENNRRVRARNIDLIRERYYVKMVSASEIEWFIVTKITESVDDKGEVKSIECVSVPQELNDKTFSVYKEDSKNMREVVQDILSRTVSWSIGSIDPDFELSYRAWDFNNETLLGAIFQVAERYNAIIEWDTENREVSFIKPELHGVYKLGEVDYERLVKSINKESDSTKIITRLTPRGKDGLTIQRLTPNGQAYLEDFSYWMYPFERDNDKNVLNHSYHMSDSLCHAILDYQELQESYRGQVGALNADKSSLQSNRISKEQELSNLKAELKAIVQLKTALETDGKMFYDKIAYSTSSFSRNYMISDIEYYAVLVHSENPYGITLTVNGQICPMSLNQWNVARKINIGNTNVNVSLSGSGISTVWIQVVAITQLEYNTSGNEVNIVEKYSDLNKKQQIESKEDEISSIQDQIDDIDDELSDIRSTLSFSNNFATYQIEELDKFILEEDYSDESIVSDEDLLEESTKKFKEFQTPQLSLKIDMVNFLGIIEEQRLWGKLRLGDKIIVRHDAFDMRIEAKIIEIEYDEEGDNISLTIANYKDLSTAEEQLQKYLYQTGQKADSLVSNVEKWNQAIVDTSEMSRLFEHFWDKTTNQINMAINQTVFMGDNGITVTDHNDPLRFLRITNSVIGLTKSGGLRFETAISPDGVIAEQILGRIILGSRVVISNDDGTWLTEGAATTITDRCGRIAMRLGLYEESLDKFGMVINRYDNDTLCSTNLINKIIANSEDGFKIQQWNGTQFVDKFYADVDGLLFAEDMTAKRLKILSGTDELILDSYEKYMNIGKFDNIITDGKLTSIEKLQVKGEKERIQSEYTKLFNQAETYKTTSRDASLRIDTTDFTTAYNELIAYINPLLANMDSTSDIDRDEFVQKFKDYYDEVTNIINAINDSIKYSSVQFGAWFNNVILDYQQGVTVIRNDNMYRTRLNATDGISIEKWNPLNEQWIKKFYVNATDGRLWAEELVAKKLTIVNDLNDILLDVETGYLNIGRFDSLITDGKLTPIEKLSLKQEVETIVTEYAKLLSQANAYKTSQRDAHSTTLINIPPFTSAYNSLMSYVTPLLADMDEITEVNRTTFKNTFQAYYDQAKRIINEITDALKWSSVQFGTAYNKVVIDATDGVVATRTDETYRSLMNATKGFAIQKKSGSVWVDVFSVNPDGFLTASGIRVLNSGIEGTYIILRDGSGGVMKLYPSDGLWAGHENQSSAPLWISPTGKFKLQGKNGAVFIDTDAGYMDMNSLDIRGVGRLSGDTITVNNVIAGYGYINRLTVDKLITYGKNEELGQVTDYIHIQDNYFRLKTGVITGRTQASANGKLLYWTDSNKTTVTDQITSYPVYNLTVNDTDKMIIGFDESDPNKSPKITIGDGSGYTDTSGKAFIRKPNASYIHEYYTSDNDDPRRITMDNLGITIRSQQGLIKIEHHTGTYFEISSNGNDIKMFHKTSGGITLTTSGLTANITGNISMNATGAINFSGSSYNYS
jgi:phage minor structural protein, N-terminal region